MIFFFFSKNLLKQLRREVEVRCLEYPGASNIGSQLLEGTAPMAGKSCNLEPLAPTRKGRKQAPTEQVSGKREGREGRGGANR